MNTESLTHKTFKNISWNLIGYAWVFIFPIFITPVIVLKLGVEMYGVYLLVLSAGNIVGLMDLGIAQILLKYIAKYSASREDNKLKDLIYSFNLILFVSSILAFIFLTTLGYWAHVFFPSSIVSAQQYFVYFFLYGIITFISGMTALFSITPVALQRFDITNKLGIINLTLSNITILLLVILGYGLKAIFLSQLAYAIIFFLIFRHKTQKILPLAKLKFAWKWEEVKNAYKFGVTVSMSNMANSALTYFDRFLIPIFYGPSALTYYTMPTSVAAKTPGVISALSGVIFPMISGLHGIDDMEKIKNIYKRSFNLLTVVNFAVTISIILFANKILLYWLNEEFATKSTTVLIILALTYYFLALGGTLNSFLLGLGKTRFLFLSSLFMAILNIGLLVLLLPKFNIIGAAWAYLLSVLPIIYMFYFVEIKILKLEKRLINYTTLYLKILITAIPFVFTCKFAILPLVNNLASVVFFGPLSVILFLFMYRVFKFFNQDDVKAIDNFIITIFKNINFKKNYEQVI